MRLVGNLINCSGWFLESVYVLVAAFSNNLLVSRYLTVNCTTLVDKALTES